MINTESIIQKAQDLEIEYAETGEYTPYRISQLLNDILETLDATRPDGKAYRVTPQMIYTYAKNGRIDGHKYESGSHARFDQDTVELFLAKFIKRNPYVNLPAENA